MDAKSCVRLQPINWGSDPTWVRFIQSYLVHRVWRERDTASSLGRIRIAAERLCESAGDTSDDAVRACIHPLCGLAFNAGTAQTSSLFNEVAARDEEFGNGDQEMDLFVAAVYLDRMPLVKAIIEAEGDIHVEPSWLSKSDVFGELFAAATLRGNVEMLRLLASADPDIKDGVLTVDLRTKVIRGAAIGGHGDAFDYAIAEGPPLVIPKDARYPFYSHLQLSLRITPVPAHYAKVMAILGPENRALGESVSGDRLTRLTKSARLGHIEMVRYFLEQGVEVNEPLSNRDINLEPLDPRRAHRATMKPLLYSITNGRQDIVKLLLDHGADPNWYSEVDTALMAAARKGSLPIARLLVQHGAGVNDGAPPPIVLAVRNEHVDMFRFLRENGAVLDTPETGAWAMAVAQHYGLESMIELLVREGVERDALLHRVPAYGEPYQRCHLFKTSEYGWAEEALKFEGSFHR